MSVYLKPFLFILAWMCLLRPAGAAPLHLVEDFELSNGGFTTTSLNSWKWGVPTSPEGPGVAHSGTQVWGTNISGSYASNLDATLRSPLYDLSAAAGQHLVLHWWQYLVTEQGFDFALVQVSKNGGGTWETVSGPSAGVVNNSWTQHTVLLDPSYATADFQIRFRLVTDNSTSEGGFFVDDIRISCAAFSEAVAVQDFETDEGGYLEDGTNSSWEYGTPVSAPGSAASGQFAWATNLSGFYNADEDSTLTSPTLDLSASAGKLLAVTWMQYFETEAGYDFFDVEVSADNGGSWTTITTLSGEVSTGGWMPQQAFLPASFATSTFQLRFRLRSDDAYQYDGVAIDDIAVLATEELFPTTGSFAKSAPENFSIQFTRANFVSRYQDPDGGSLTGIVIEQLPASGLLKLGDTPVLLNAFIPTALLDTLIYEPAADTTGVWSFDYSASNFFAASAAATVTLSILGPTPLVMITEPPDAATVNPGSSHTFRVVAVSTLTLNYQWRKNGADILDATESTYTISPVTEDDEDTYDVVVSNASDSADSNSAFLSVNDPVTIVSQPGPTNVNEGDDISLTVTATGTGRLDYQWYKDDVALLDETFPTLTLEEVEEADGGLYHCVVTNIVGPIPTQAFSLTVLLAPRITIHPLSIGIKKLRPASFEVVVEGAGPFTYQWYKDGFEMPGAIESVLVIENLTDDNMGNYTVRVSNGWATVESEPAQLQVLLWQDVRGTYQDVLEFDSVIPGESPYSGRLTVTLNGLGSASATLTYDGSTHRFAGRLNSQLILERLIKRGKRTPLNVRIQLDTLAFTISAAVSQEEPGGALLSSALLPKHRYINNVNNAPQKGRYTILLTPDDGVAAAPQAPGFLTGLVYGSGQATLVGRLPNGLTLLSSGFVHETGRLPFHRMLGLTNGEVCGRLGFDLSGEIPFVNGDLVWRHLAKATATYMPTPFVVSLEADGSLYTIPTLVQPVVTLPQNADMFTLAIEGPITDGSLDRWLRLEPRHTFLVDPATDAKIILKLNRTNGTLKGSFIDVGTKKRYVLDGVVIQGRLVMGGYFRGLNEPGEFSIAPLLR